MSSQIDKFNEHQKKTAKMRREDPKRRNKRKTKMPKNNWNEQLKNSEEYKQALELGLSLDDLSADSQEKMLEALKELKKRLAEAQTKASEDKPEIAPDGKSENAPDGKSENTSDGKPENDPDGKKDTLEINGSPEHEDDEPTNDVDWIKEKRKFYQEYAQKIGAEFDNDEQKDAQEKSFSFSFKKNGKSMGEVRYSSPNRVHISKDAALGMYNGLVLNALKNNLAISFGQSLNDTQRAMLLGAVLLNQDKKYSDGSGIAIMNAPKIDINAEYFKKLPEVVQNKLKTYVEQQKEEQAKQEAKDKLNARVKELRDKIRSKAAADGRAMSDLSTEEYRSAMLDGMTDEQKAARIAKIDDREQRTAARLGIIDSYKTTGKDGKPLEIKEDKETKDLLHG